MKKTANVSRLKIRAYWTIVIIIFFFFLFIVMFSKYIKAIIGTTYITILKMQYFYKHHKRIDGRLGYYPCSGITPLGYITSKERETIENIHYLRQVKEDNDYCEDEYHQLLLQIRDRMPLQKTIYEIDIIQPSEKSKLCEYIRRKQPVVIKGLAKKTKAVREWNVSKFINQYGHVDVLFSNKKGEFVDKLSSLLEYDGRYCHNMEQLFYKFPNLRNELNFNKIIDYIQSCKFKDQDPVCYAQQFFISNMKGTGVSFHNAQEDNFFIMVQGRKKWTFIDPQWTVLFSPYFNRCAMYFMSKAGHAYNPNLELCPLYHYIPKWEVVLEPGDVLYNPSYWWHSIENIDPDTLGVASRWVFETAAEHEGYCPSTCYELTNIQSSLYAMKHYWYFGFQNLQNIPLSSMLKKEMVLRQTYTNEHSAYNPTFWESASHCASSSNSSTKYAYIKKMKNEK